MSWAASNNPIGPPAMEAGLTDHVWTLKELLSKIGQE